MLESSGKKKVLIAITKSNFGGAQRYVYDLTRSLPSSDIEVVVAHGGNGILAEKLRTLGVRTIEIPSLERDVRLFADIASLRALTKIIRAEKPDVLHLNSSKMGLIGSIAGRWCGVPRIIFTAHGWPFNEERPLRQRALFYIFAQLTIVLSHRTIAVSKAVARAIGASRGTQKVVIIHNGVDRLTYLERKAARDALVKTHTPNEFWFGTIAELHPIKGLSYLIEAFRRHANVHPTARLVLIGDGEERETLRALVHSLELERQVHLCGFVDNAARYLNALDVFVLPSLSEGLSYAILDAGQARLPVIASAVGGIPEIIDDTTGILVPPRDVRALEKAFERIANDHEYREDMAAKLQARIESMFSLSAMCAKTVALYRLE